MKMANPSRIMNFLIRAITYGNADKMTTYQELKDHALQDVAGNVRSYFEQSLRYNCTSQLPRIEQPILLIYGEKDVDFHPYAQILHTGLPHSSLFFIKDAKHPVPIQSAARMNDLIHLWVESLQEKKHKERWKLDLVIAQKLHPQMYGNVGQYPSDAEHAMHRYE